MFGMSWPEIAIIIAVGMFVLGPERIPVAVKWVGSTLKTVRTMAAGAQEQLRGEFGPELDELRRQIADLQSLKEIQELRALRDLNPRAMITKNLLGDEFAGGVKGMLGLDGLADLVKPTGSGVAAETPGVETSKPVQFHAPTTAEPVALPEVIEPVTNQPGSGADHVAINYLQTTPTEVATTIDVRKPEPVSGARHAIPNTFDMDAT